MDDGNLAGQIAVNQIRLPSEADIHQFGLQAANIHRVGFELYGRKRRLESIVGRPVAEGGIADQRNLPIFGPPLPPALYRFRAYVGQAEFSKLLGHVVGRCLFGTVAGDPPPIFLPR